MQTINTEVIKCSCGGGLKVLKIERVENKKVMTKECLVCHELTVCVMPLNKNEK
jgi:hypothetical protein